MIGFDLFMSAAELEPDNLHIKHQLAILLSSVVIFHVILEWIAEIE